MPFDIRFLDPGQEVEFDGDPYCEGVIELGDHIEGFFAPLGYWSTGDYRAQWDIAVSRIVQGSRISCLVTERWDPAHGPSVIWPLLAQGLLCRVLNRLLLPAWIAGVGRYDDLCAVGVAEGEDLLTPEVSVWEVPVGEMAAWMAKRPPSGGSGLGRREAGAGEGD